MRRILAFVLSMLLCLSLFGLSAAAEDKPTLSLSSAEAKPGDTVTLELTLSGNPGLAYLQFKLGYDASALELKEVENTGLLEGGFTGSQTIGVNPYNFQWTSASDMKGNGVIARATFLVKEGASGTQTLTLLFDDAVNQRFEKIDVAVSGGKVTLPEPAQPKLSLSSAEAKPGDTVTLELTLSGNPGLAYLQFKLGYNASALELQEVKNTGLLEGGFTGSPSIEVNPYNFQWTSASDMKGNGVIARVTFLVKEEAEGAQTVRVTFDSAFDEKYDDVEIPTENGRILLPGEGYRVSVEDKTGGKASLNVDPETLYQGENEFTLTASQAACVLRKTGEGYERVEIDKTTHSFTLEVTEEIELYLAFVGDVNLDGRLTTRDVNLLQRGVAGLTEIEALAALVGDAYRDSKLSTRDVNVVSRVVAGLAEMPW